MNQTFTDKEKAAVHAISKSPSLYLKFGKRILDVSIVLFLAPIALLFVAFSCLVVRRDGGPSLYGQTRVGRDGQSFKCWKIRTMVVDADEKLEELFRSDENARLEWERDQKLKNDPRITKVGAFLRKSSLDELPQLWNVFVGEMSMIGPRPFMPQQRLIYEAGGPILAYYSVRPGITGLWQVKDRNNASFRARMEYDNEYARDISFWSDAKILLATIWVVLSGTGH